jgi:hypothetical protein
MVCGMGKQMVICPLRRVVLCRLGDVDCIIRDLDECCIFAKAFRMMDQRTVSYIYQR